MVRSRVGSSAPGSVIIGLLIGAAVVVGTAPIATRATAHGDRSGQAATIREAVEWRFSQPQPDWKPALALPTSKTAVLERTADALSIALSEDSRITPRLLTGGVYVDLPDWRREEWAEVVVRARASGSVNNMRIGLNPPEDGVVVPAGAPPAIAAFLATFQAILPDRNRGYFSPGGVTPIVRDGLVHTYRIDLDWGSQRTGPWRRVGLVFQAPAPGSIDILSVRVVPAAARQDPDRITETTLEPSQLKSDFALFRQALEEAHPTLYRYTTKRELDAQFARAEATLTRPMTLLQFRNVLAPVLAAIKDGNTGFTNYQGDEISTLVNLAKQFPLVLTFESTRAFVVLNRGIDSRVRPGMEVLSINGQPLAQILQRILPNLTQYGDVRTYQMYQLGISRGFFQRDQLSPYRTGFSEAYRLYVGDPPSFRTTLRDPRTRKIVVVDPAGVTVADAAINVEKNPVNRDVLTGLATLRALHPRNGIRYLDGEDTAILTPSWDPNTPEFFKEAFAGLRSRGTKNLIVDMRGNTGGFDQYPPLLFSYLTSTEFRHMERMYMKTYEPSFTRYTVRPQIDPVTDAYYGSAAGIWKPDPNGGWLITEKYPIIGVQKPSENHFGGAVYVLIDGASISATAEFCATVDFYKRATFIGEETGGAAEGDTGGGDTGPTLPASHLHFRIPMEAYFSVVDETNRRRGTLPKHAVMQTVDDLAKGRDTVLEFTRDLIRNGKGVKKAGRYLR